MHACKLAQVCKHNMCVPACKDVCMHESTQGCTDEQSGGVQFDDGRSQRAPRGRMLSAPPRSLTLLCDAERERESTCKYDVDACLHAGMYICR